MDDVQHVNRIAKAAGLSAYPVVQARALVENGPDAALLLWAPAFCRNPIAFVVVRVLPPEAEIWDIAVSPAFRRFGLGGRLLEAAASEMGRRGVERVFLEVRPSNVAAVRFYERHGFTRSGTRRDYYSHPCEDAWVMSGSVRLQRRQWIDQSIGSPA